MIVEVGIPGEGFAQVEFSTPMPADWNLMEWWSWSQRTFPRI